MRGAHTRYGGSTIHMGRTVLGVEDWAAFAGITVDEARALGDIRVWVDSNGLNLVDRTDPPIVDQATLRGHATRIARGWARASGGAYRLG